MAFRTDKSVLFMEVASIQRCPDREVPPYICMYIYKCTLYMKGIVHVLAMIDFSNAEI